MPNELINKIQLLRDKYTFESDRQNTYLWEKQIRDLIVKKDLKSFDGIKELVSELEGMVKEISYLLSWDKNLTEDKRKLAFVRREVYQWVISFFKSPAEIIAGIEKNVEEELK